MRPSRVLLAGVVFLALSAPAVSDVLRLSNGGEIKGTIENVTFRADGKTAMHPRSQLVMLWISQAGQDQLVLAGGRKLLGELVAVKLRSIAGVLTFQRDRVKGVTFTADPLSEAKKEYAARKARLAEGDADARLALARWCQAKGLKVEALHLAEAALKCNPSPTAAERAHKLLGHVRHEGKWIPPIELAELLLQSEKTEEAKPAQDKPRKETLPEPTFKATVPPKTLEALRAAAARNKQLCQTYLQRCDTGQREEHARLVQVYGTRWTAYKVRIRQLTAQLKKSRKSTSTAASGTSSQSKPQLALVRATTGQPRTTGSAADVSRLKEQLRQAKRGRARLAAAISTARSKIAARWRTRRARVREAYRRNLEQLNAGKVLDEKEMSRRFRAAFRAN